MRLKPFVLFLIISIFTGCFIRNDSGKENENRFKSSLNKEKLRILAESKQKFAFIRRHDPDEKRIGMEYGFGDIFVYNMPDSTLYRLTDDNDREENLCWSPDGTKLIFASSRDHFDWRIHDDGQESARSNLFVLDLNSGHIDQFRFIPPDISITSFDDLTWEKNGIYFSTYDNKVYRINEFGDSLSVVISIDEEFQIGGINISEDEKYMLFQANPVHLNDSTKIGLYYFESKELKWIMKFARNITIGRLNELNNTFFFTRRDTVLQYNIETGIETPFILSGITNKLKIDDCSFISDEEVVCVFGDNIFKDYLGKIREARYGLAIGIENIKTKQLRYVISDNHIKSSLEVYYSK